VLIGTLANDVAGSQVPKTPNVSDLGRTRLHHNARYLRSSLAKYSQHVFAFGIWQVFIDQDQIENLRPYKLERLSCGPNRGGVESRILKHLFQDYDDLLVTIGYQNFFSRCFHGFELCNDNSTIGTLFLRQN